MHRRFALVPVVALFAASGAYAQERPWYVGVQQTFGHLEDVIVSPISTSDNFSTTALRGGVNTMLGRQRVYLDGTIFRTLYDKNNDLDYTGHNVYGGLDWATAGNLSGGLAAGTNKNRVRLTVPNEADPFNPLLPADTRNPIQRVDTFDASARYGAGGPLGVVATYGFRKLSYDDDNGFVAAEEYDQDDVTAGITYRLSGALTVGGGLHGQRTDYQNPNPRQPGEPADQSRRKAVYVSADWAPSAASIVDARLSFGETKYDVFTERNTSGLTGHVSWDWRPTAKLRFLSTLASDTGSDVYVTRSGVLTPGSTTTGSTADPATTPPQGTPPAATPLDPTGDVLTTTAFATTTSTLSVRGTWEATAKILVEAGLTYLRSNFSGSSSSDSTAMLLGASWAPTRALSFGCNYAQEFRSGNVDPLSFSCYGQFMIR